MPTAWELRAGGKEAAWLLAAANCNFPASGVFHLIAAEYRSHQLGNSPIPWASKELIGASGQGLQARHSAAHGQRPREHTKLTFCCGVGNLLPTEFFLDSYILGWTHSCSCNTCVHLVSSFAL